jgi:hypothetical protein
LVIARPASELLLGHHSIIASTDHSSSLSKAAMPNFGCRKSVHDLFTSKKRKLSVQQNFQQLLAQQAAASTNENRVSNEFPPNEPMVKSCDGEENADECMSECTDHNDGHQGATEDSFSDSKASFVLLSDDSRSLEDDDNQNNFIFDDIFGIETMDDGMTDDQQSLKMTPASCTPQTMMYQDKVEKPPRAEDDVEFTDLEVAGLELLMLCDASSARR